MRRGDIVLANFAGDYGKPRPAVIIQSDELTSQGFSSVVVCPVTSTIRSVPLVRVSIEPDETNGLRRRSQVMVEKITALAEHRLKRVIGRLDEETMKSVESSLLLTLGFV